MTQRIVRCFLITALIFFSSVSRAEIAQGPLFLSAVGVDPNVMLILDDSGSMQYSYIPDICEDYIYKRAKSPYFNTIYYDPETNYLPPIKPDDSGSLSTTFTKAWSDGYDLDSSGNPQGSSVDLSKDFQPTWGGPVCTYTYAHCGRVPRSQRSGSPCYIYYKDLVPQPGRPDNCSINDRSDPDCNVLNPNYSGFGDSSKQKAYYYQFDKSLANCDQTATNEDCYRKVVIQGAEQEQNFANWYSFYRTRMLTTKAGASLAFSAQSSRLRIGSGTINKAVSSDGKNILYEGVKPFSESTTKFKPNRDGCQGVRVSNYLWAKHPCYLLYTTAGLTREEASKENASYGGGNCSSYNSSTDPDCWVFRPLRNNCDGTEADPDCTITVYNRKPFFEWLYGIDASGSTPLRNALDAAGRYYQTKAPWRLDPDPDIIDGEIFSCRQSYTILMTDGYWNSTAASIATGNNDGTAGDKIEGPNQQTFTYSPVKPFKDTFSGTLADVAMYYWKKDLLTDVENRVPTNDRDPAFWQHMVTFGIGLGVPTQKVTPEEAFNAIDKPQSEITWTWPDPDTGNTSDSATIPARIDDLLHAAVNGRGDFFNAQNSEEFTARFQNLLNDIVVREESSATAVATNSARLGTDSALYEARFNSDGWSGHLVATAFADDGTLGNQLWSTDDPSTFPDARKIYTLAGTQKVEFLWDSLTDDQKANLIGSDDEALAKKRLNWLRGDRTTENVLRQREALLGDIINSNPILVEQDGKKMLYVGANDGMLHAFDAETGEEKFAFIPKAVFPNLATLTNPNYTEHRYFVDGSPQLFKVDGKSYLITSTGAGGRSVFTLDITEQGSFSKDDILWEFTATDDPLTTIIDGDSDVGYVIGQASIGKLSNGTPVAVFGNGYEGATGKAFLFVVKLASGELISKITTNDDTGNGLATPTLLIEKDASGNEYIAAAYAGDLRGNLWKFDLDGGDSELLFKAKDDKGVSQPITAAPDVGRHPQQGYVVIFGTGKYFEKGDHNEAASPVQSLYGLWDKNDGSKITDRGVLQEQVFFEKEVAGNNFRAITKNKLDWNTQRGWYVDLTPEANYGRAVGERVTAKPILNLGRAIFTTRIFYESDDPCIPSTGTSWVMVIDMITGGQVVDQDTKDVVTLFDVNRDTQFDRYDWIQSSPSGEPLPAIGFQTQTAGLASGVTLLEIKHEDGSTSFDLIFSGSEKLTTTATSQSQSNEAAARLALGAARAAEAAARGDVAGARQAATEAGASEAAIAAAVAAAQRVAAAREAALAAGKTPAEADAAAAQAAVTATRDAAQAIDSTLVTSSNISALVNAPTEGVPAAELLGRVYQIVASLKGAAAFLQGDEGVGVRLAGTEPVPSQEGGRRSWRQVR